MQGRLRGILDKNDFGAPLGELTGAALRVLESRYLMRDRTGRPVESPRQLFERVARAVASAESRWWKSRSGSSRDEYVDGYAQKFFELMASLRFLPNSPTLMNAGRPKGQLSACFVLPIDDDLGEVFGSLKNAAVIHKTGGGTGFSFGKLRPAGDLISTSGGRASGPLAFLKIFDVATNTVKQGGTRRGANMAILPVDHPDIEQFIQSKTKGGIENFNISVGISDTFMLAVKTGAKWKLKSPKNGEVVREVAARKIWRMIAEAAWISGDPGVVFLDRINDANPTPEIGPMESTNPCVTGDSRIWVEDKGFIPIRDLVGQTPRLATESAGEMAFCRATSVVQTGIRPVFRLETVEGYELRLTEEHLVATDHGDVPAGELQPGDRVRLLCAGQAAEISNETADARLGELIGWLVGDGHFTQHSQGKKTVVLSFYGKEKKSAGRRILETACAIIEDPELRLCEVSSRDLAYVRSQRLLRHLNEIGVDISCKERVPEAVWRGSTELVSGYLRGLFSADGSVQGKKEKGVSVRLAANKLELLKQVQVLLLHLGVKSVLYQNRRTAGVRFLPDANGDLCEYLCAAQHELIISKASLKSFCTQVGFLIPEKQNALKDILAGYERGPYRENFFAIVSKVEPAGEEEVFDLSEPVTSHFFANGILVHNCGEQPLLPFESCNLGSMNLLAYVKGKALAWDELERDIHLAIRFLDDVIEANSYPLLEIEEITMMNRKIGLGVMGWADVLMEWGVAYDSEEAIERADEVMSRFSRIAVEASEALAKERGPFPGFSKSIWAKRGDKPRRNATVTTVAPTGTISIIAGVSSGIEPVFSLAFERTALEGERMIFVHPALKRALRGYDIRSRKVLAKVLEEGAVSNVKELPPRIRRSLRTAMEIKPGWHVRMQAAFQKYTENGVSKTINLPKTATVMDIQKIYAAAYSLGCKGITVFRDASKDTQVLKRGLDSRTARQKEIIDAVDWLLDDEIDKKTARKKVSVGLASLSRAHLKKQKN